MTNEGGHHVITVRGADAVGAMYGGLDIAEAIRMGTLDSLKDSDHRPYIAQRGIKFNIPLDLRMPSYSDCSDAAQANIPEMWEREFWIDYLNTMARHRYNVLSLWSLHPFPSMAKVPEFPEVALNDVWRTKAKLDDTFRFAGSVTVRKVWVQLASACPYRQVFTHVWQNLRDWAPRADQRLAPCRSLSSVLMAITRTD